MNSYTIQAKPSYNIHNEKISVIIPAAGAGTRMKYVGPKALIDLPNTTDVLIERQIKLILESYPNAEIIITVGFYADKICRLLKKKYPIRFVFNSQYSTTNVVHSIALGLYNSIIDKVLIIYGDLIFNKETIYNIVSPTKSQTIIDTKNRLDDNTVGVIFNSNDSLITNFAYDISQKWGQIIFLQGKELRLFEQFSINPDYNNLYGYEILNKVIEKGGNISAIEPSNMKLLEIDTPKDIEKIGRIYG